MMKRQEADLEVALQYWSGWTASRRESISGTGQVGCCGDKDRGATLRCSEQGKRSGEKVWRRRGEKTNGCIRVQVGVREEDGGLRQVDNHATVMTETNETKPITSNSRLIAMTGTTLKR